MRRALRHVADSDVPCGDCSACCSTSHFVHVGPEEHDALAHVPRELLFAAPGMPAGHVLLPYDDRGRCPLLDEGGRCSIYATGRSRAAPTTAACSPRPASTPTVSRSRARARRWRFTCPAPGDAAGLAAVARRRALDPRARGGVPRRRRAGRPGGSRRARRPGRRRLPPGRSRPPPAPTTRPSRRRSSARRPTRWDERYSRPRTSGGRVSRPHRRARPTPTAGAGRDREPLPPRDRGAAAARSVRRVAARHHRHARQGRPGRRAVRRLQRLLPHVPPDPPAAGGEARAQAAAQGVPLAPRAACRRATCCSGFTENGACPVLIDGRCTIYEDRPLVCRTYDCRMYAATGVEPDRADIAAQVRRWRFELPGRRGPRAAGGGARGRPLHPRGAARACRARRRGEQPIRVATLAVARAREVPAGRDARRSAPAGRRPGPRPRRRRRQRGTVRRRLTPLGRPAYPVGSRRRPPARVDRREA